LIALTPTLSASAIRSLAGEDPGSVEEFQNLLTKTGEKGWGDLPIGTLMGHLGFLLEGAPYLPGTLDADGPEKCRVDLKTMDCVTYFENILGVARVIKKKKKTFNDLVKEVTYTRYRDGKLNGYVSRLHYTADWIEDNIKKGVVRDVTGEMGGVELKISDTYMSTHPDSYPQLKGNAKLIDAIKKIEDTINSKSRLYIPKGDIEDAEEKMLTGDIIAVATSKEGLDYAHTGMIYRDHKGEARFLHESTKYGMVTLDKTISEYVNSVKTHIGITVVRPLEPTA